MKRFRAAPVLFNNLSLFFLSLFSVVPLEESHAQGSSTWEPMKGPTAAPTVMARMVDGTIIGSFGRGIMGSEDGGSTWEIIQTSAGVALDVLICDSLGTLIGSDNSVGLPMSGGTSYRSTDNGRTWSIIWLTEFGDPAVAMFAVAADNRIMAATNHGFLESSDDGVTWSADTIAYEWESVTALAVTGDDAVLALLEGGEIFRREFPEGSWIKVDSTHGFATLALSPDEYLFGITGLGLMRSPDLGHTWDLVNADLRSYKAFSVVCGSDSVVLVTTLSGIVRSGDLGDHWEDTGTQALNPGSVLVVDSTDLLASGNVGLIRSTDNGHSWQVASGGGLPLVGCGYIERGDLGWVYAGHDGAIYGSPDEGVTWRLLYRVFVGDDDFYPHLIRATSQSPTGGMVFATWYGGIYSTPDHGTTWNSLSGSQSVLWQPAALCIDCRGDMLGGDSWGLVYLRRNGASEWIEILRFADYPNAWLRCLAVDTSGTYYVGYRGGLKASYDGGATWTDAPELVSKNVRALSVDAAGRVFAGTEEHGIFVSDDGGASWSPLSDGLNGATITAIEPLRYGETLCATSAGGAFRLDRGAVEWNPLGDGLPGAEVKSLASDPAGRAYAATGLGVFRTVSPVSGIASPHLEIPGTVQLQQNYPNPFNPSTTIKYDLPKSSMVRLSVYDMLGREVSVLVNDRRDVGVHKFNFDASGLASGVYLYRLQVGSYVETRKLVLVR